MKRDHLLSEDLRQRLSAIGDRLASGAPPEHAILERMIADLALLPDESVSRVWYEINAAMRLGWTRSTPPKFLSLLSRLYQPLPEALSERDLLAGDPLYAWLFLFHSDGRIREAALDRLADPPTTAFFFAAIALRLNDWAEQVRAAAVRCAERVFPLVSPDLAARAALPLIDKAFQWERWSDERQALDAVFANPAVLAQMFPLFMTGSNGPLATRLRQLLRYPGLDRDLPELARGAVQPSVRANALKCLIDRKVSWPIGHDWKWIDKAYNLRQRIVLTDSRPIVPDQAPEVFIRMGLDDRSAVVRRVAADAVIENRTTLSDVDVLVARMAADRSPAIRERADYMIRHPL
jgi:hypothetical protein